ncbi:hypothetical protein ACQEVB_34800 [Pseudonocardia sp. CA-107938]|uniref:hypothetical protein n=1 Tax=Pseudonocardia sp. CA-107938 TaxID=3240021 RepID=UPI003D945CCF
MGDVTVPVSAIGDAGRLAASVAGDVGGVDVAGPAGEIAAALPGSRSAQVAASAAQLWRAEIANVTTAMQDYGLHLADAAAAYADAEQDQLRLIAAASAVVPGPAALVEQAAAELPSRIREALG